MGKGKDMPHTPTKQSRPKTYGMASKCVGVIKEYEAST